MRQLALPVVAIAAALTLSPVSAFGQSGQPIALTPQTVAAANAQADAQEVRRVTVDEAVKLALDQNLGVQIQRLDPQIQDETVAQARAQWLPNLSSQFSKNSQSSPSTSVLSGSASTLTSGLFSGQVGINEFLPTGANYTAQWGSSRSTTTDISSFFNPILRSSVFATVTQPLLRNRAIDTIRQQVAVSKKIRDISDVNLRATMVQTARNVKNAYWDLVYQIDNLKAAQDTLSLAQQSLKDNTRRVEIGTMAPIDIVDAKVEVARDEEAVILAQEGIEQAQDTLRMLIYDPKTTPNFWTLRIEPNETAPFQAQQIDVEAAVRNALDHRSDIRSAKLTVQESDINIRYFRNQILPDVNLNAQYTAAGLGGVELQPVNPLDSSSTARQIVAERSLTSALGDVFTNAYPTWQVGFQINYPLGLSTPKANLAKAKLQYQQSQTQMRNIEMQVVAQVRTVARQVQANQKRVESARASRELAEQKLAAEEKKFSAGIEQAFFVFQAQRDLSSARTAEVQAIADYNKSLVDFEAVQEVNVNGGTSGIAAVGGQ